MGQLWRYYWLIPAYLLAASIGLLFESTRNLEYEYSLLTSFSLLILIPAVGFLLPSRDIPKIEGRYVPLVAFDTLWIVLIAPGLLLIPAGIVFLADLCGCSRNGFLFWMVLSVLPTWFLAHGIMHGILWGRVRGLRRRKMMIGLAAGYALLAISIVCVFWFMPQKRGVTLLMGFLHGPIYDRWIPVDNGIAFMRLVHALVGVGLLAIFRSWTRWGRITYALGFGGLVLAGYLYAQQFPSVRNGQATLNELMPETLADAGIVLHFRKKDPSKETPRHIKRIFAESLFHAKDLREKLGLEVAETHIYLYPNRQSKKLWFGGGSTDVTDVVTPSIHITYDQFPHATLRHELVHAITSENAFYGLGFHPNMAFTEGIAVALAPEEQELSFDESVAGMVYDKKMPKVNNLLSPMFWSESGARAYTVAGSLIKYLESTYGLKAVAKLYSGSDFEDAVGKSKGKVLADWGSHILKSHKKGEHQLLVESRFRSEGVFADRCPHSKQDLARSRAESPYVRLRQPLNWRPERDYYPWRLHIEPDDRQAQLSSWRREINKIAKERTTSQGRLKVWAKALNRAKHWPPKSIEDIHMSILEADLYMLTSDTQKSLKVLQTIHDFSRKKNIGNGLMRQVEARTTIAATLPPGEVLKWWKYLAGWSDIPRYNASDEGWLLSYLRVRKGEKSIAFPQALTKFLDEPPPAGFSNTFYVEWYKYLGHQLIRAGEYKKASNAYSMAQKKSPEASKEFFGLLARQSHYFSGLDESLQF